MCVCVYSVAKSCLTLCDPMDCSLTGSSAHGIFQARIRSRLPFPTPRDLPNPGLNQCLLHWQADSLPLCHLGSPNKHHTYPQQLLFWRGGGCATGSVACKILVPNRELSTRAPCSGKLESLTLGHQGSPHNSFDSGEKATEQCVSDRVIAS